MQMDYQPFRRTSSFGSLDGIEPRALRDGMRGLQPG
jgi:hypothetical protein